MFGKTSPSFKHDGFAYLSPQSSFIFCGLRLLPNKEFRYGITQDEYRPDIPILTSAVFFAHAATYLKPSQILTAGKQFAGESIWITQTRYDVCFDLSYGYFSDCVVLGFQSS